MLLVTGVGRDSTALEALVALLTTSTATLRIGNDSTTFAKSKFLFGRFSQIAKGE